MRIYPNSECDLTIQSYGSTWFALLRGKEDAITETFYGLFNLKATSGKLEFLNGPKTIAKFWTSEKQMRKFFSNLFYFRTDLDAMAQFKGQKDGYKELMQPVIDKQIAELRGTMETFEPREKRSYNPLFEVGTMSAEKPDGDMKDAILSNAYASKEAEQSEIKREMDIAFDKH